MKKIVNKIIINLNKNDDVNSKFNDQILSPELGNYIYDQYTGFKENGIINLVISSDEKMDDEFKNKLTSMIIDYFKSNINELNKIHNKLYIKSMIMSIIGIIFIIITNFLNLYNDHIISEIFMIAGWVLLWEVVDNIVFKESKWHSRYNGYKKLLKCNIEFV